MMTHYLLGKLIGVVIAATLLGGCGSIVYSDYIRAVTQNQQALQDLRLGMSRSEMYALMGDGDVIQYKSIHFSDPWRSESFQLVDGTHVLIVFYLTQPPSRRYGTPEDQALTPIVIENGVLKGWGWSYLRRNTDRYGVESHKEQQ